MLIKQSRKMATKFIDPNPSNRVVFGTSGTGPATKNLAKLYAPAKELRRKDIMGTASELCQLIVGAMSPYGVIGKNEDVNMMRANDICD